MSHNSANGDEDKKKKSAKLKRDETGKLIVTYKSRLLEPKKHDEQWRAKKLADYEKERENTLKKGSMLGYFSPSRSAAYGDTYVSSSQIEAKQARGKGPQFI